MEIHKPKPIHNWREFLTELGTIVLGIVIAIGLEQLVESWHWAGEVKTARQAIKAEMAANNENLFVFRIAIAPCVDKEIADAGRALDAMQAGSATATAGNIRSAPGALTRDSEWQSERASQVLTHFPRSELALMSRYYAQLPSFGDWNTRESDALRELSILDRPQPRITAAEINRLRIALNAAEEAEFLTVINARRQLALSRQLGIPDPKLDPLRAKNYCVMSTEEYRRYRTSQDLR